MRDTRETLIRKLLNEMPELMADYDHVVRDMENKLDAVRKARIKKIYAILAKINELGN